LKTESRKDGERVKNQEKVKAIPADLSLSCLGFLVPSLSLEGRDEDEQRGSKGFDSSLPPVLALTR